MARSLCKGKFGEKRRGHQGASPRPPPPERKVIWKPCEPAPVISLLRLSVFLCPPCHSPCITMPGSPASPCGFSVSPLNRPLGPGHCLDHMCAHDIMPTAAARRKSLRYPSVDSLVPKGPMFAQFPESEVRCCMRGRRSPAGLFKVPSHLPGRGTWTKRHV